ncbi:uncharacterized protein LOC121378534 [Gigantopelta aegis]|uniref:uncharacterized protein LOC121378534 n=1 Tax=Gigantopelta aegis TaxID=1735272 RepID=UPI001B8880BE|nr:uncharacterized protein LOC121378534 [Gigantopelta aegis]
MILFFVLAGFVQYEGLYVAAKPLCPEETYYDTSTRNCDPCSLICYRAEIQGTAKKCQELCPGYSMSTPSTTRAETDEPGDDNLKILLAVIMSLVIIVAVISILILKYRQKIAQIICSWRQTPHEVIGHGRRDAGSGVKAHDHQPHNLEPVDMLNLERQDEEISNGVGGDQSRAVFKNAQESERMHTQETDKMLEEQSEQTGGKY